MIFFKLLSLNNLGPVTTVLSAIRESDISYYGDSANIRNTANTTIHWSSSHDRNMTSYVVTVSPAAAPCSEDGDGNSTGVCMVSAGDSGFEDRRLSLLLELGIEYRVTVSTINCGTQAGNNSDPLLILLQGISPFQ